MSVYMCGVYTCYSEVLYIVLQVKDLIVVMMNRQCHILQHHQWHHYSVVLITANTVLFKIVVLKNWKKIYKLLEKRGNVWKILCIPYVMISNLITKKHLR